MRLNELFDKAPKKFGKDVGSRDEKFYEFKVGKEKYFIQFNSGTSISGDPREENNWSISYGYNRDKRPYEPDRSNGNALKVLGTVVHYIERFLKEEKPTQLKFSGENEFGLADVYSRMISVLRKRANALGYEFSQRALSDTLTSFIIYRKDVGKLDHYDDVPLKKKVSEAFDSPVEHTANVVKSGPRKVYNFSVEDNKYFAEFDLVEHRKDVVYELSYGFVGKPLWSQFEPTGKASKKVALQVLSTVVKILEKFLLEQDPDIVKFNGVKEENLSNIYTMMVKNLNTHLADAGYKVESEDGGDITYFYIVRDKD